ncbi:MAG: T9SS type A sorting domain-containing protein, partial [Bacteroidota bacterium]
IILLTPVMSRSQVTVFSDDFTVSQGTGYTTAAGPIGTSTVWFMNNVSSAFGAKIDGGILNLVNASPAGAVFAYTSTNSFLAPYNPQLNLNTGIVTWTFNIRQIRTDPSGWVSGSYSAAVILASSSSNALTSGNGYAITFGQSGSTDPLLLIRYSGGIRTGTRTTILTSNTTGLADFGAEYLSVKITYTQSTDTWEMFVRNDGTTGFADPAAGTLTSQGTVADNTYTGTALGYMGAAWNGSTSANQTAFFDNFKVTAEKKNQTITFGPLADKTMGDAPFALTATASSGLSVSYTSSDNGVASVAGNIVTINGEGSCTIYADQPGNEYFNPAPQAEQPLTVNPAPTYDVTFNVDDGTNPIENAEVTLNGNPQMTNASGQTVFSGLSDGIYPYSVTKAGFQDDNGNVTVSGGNVIKNISLSQATYNVTFNVKDADTNPIENAEVTFDGSPQYTNASGTTIFSGYVNGIYPYSVTKSGYVTDNGNVTISGNHVVKNVTLNLQTYDVTFNVSDGTSPIENAEVIFDGSTQYTNASGSTVFAGVEVGSALPYSVTKAGYMDVNSTVDVVDQNVTENVVMGESIPTTTLMAANCGASYTTSNTWIYCYEITGAEDYEFKFVNVGESFNETVLMSTVWGSPIHNYFRLYHVPNLKFGVTYDVQVRSKVSGTWSDYGAVCQVTLKGTKLSTAYCGATVSTTNYTIYADMISGATNYEFRFVNTGEGFEESQTTVSVWGASYGSRNYLKLMYIPYLEYGLTYDVQVRALVNGIWSNYDDVCQFTLSVGLTKLIDGQCGGSINYPNYYIYCDLVYQAEDYEFRFVNAGAGFDQSRTTSSVWGATYGWRRYMRLYYIPGLQYGLTYDVQVRARINGTWGAYGTVCQFTYGPSTKEGTFSGNSNMALNIKPQLFPNPFDKSTTFVLSGDNDQEFNVYICDVTGKILNEQFLYSNTEYIIGEELDRGVYFLIILGHNNSMNETLKFIKQ